MSSGCGCKEVHVYIFPHNYYLSLYTPLVSALFTAESLLFIHFFSVFRSLV